MTRTAMREHIFEILKTDGTENRHHTSAQDSAAEQRPLARVWPHGEKANWVIVGGTGAYMGARGQVGGTGRQAARPRWPSPATGANQRRAESIHPACCSLGPPANCQHPAGPAIFHSDVARITAWNPAIAGRSIFPLCYRPRTDVPRCGPHTAVSVEPTFDRECTGHHHGWWTGRRCC